MVNGQWLSLFLVTEISHYVKELGERTHIHLRKLIVLEFLKMSVIANNICSSRDNCTIHKLIVVRICSDKIESERRVHTLYVRRFMKQA